MCLPHTGSWSRHPWHTSSHAGRCSCAPSLPRQALWLACVLCHANSVKAPAVLFHACTNICYARQVPASSFSEVFDTARLASGGGVRILPLAHFKVLHACGLWPTADRMCLSCSVGGERKTKGATNCRKAEHTCGMDIPW